MQMFFLSIAYRLQHVISMTIEALQQISLRLIIKIYISLCAICQVMVNLPFVIVVWIQISRTFRTKSQSKEEQLYPKTKINWSILEVVSNSSVKEEET